MAFYVILGFNRLREFVELLTCDRQTDRRADGQTDGRSHDDSIYRANIASRGKNGSRHPDHAPFRDDVSFLI